MPDGSHGLRGGLLGVPSMLLTPMHPGRQPSCPFSPPPCCTSLSQYCKDSCGWVGGAGNSSREEGRKEGGRQDIHLPYGTSQVSSGHAPSRACHYWNWSVLIYAISLDHRRACPLAWVCASSPAFPWDSQPTWHFLVCPYAVLTFLP